MTLRPRWGRRNRRRTRAAPTDGADGADGILLGPGPSGGTPCGFHLAFQSWPPELIRVGGAAIDTADGRRARWFQTLDEIEALDGDLALRLVPLSDDPILMPLVAEIERGLLLARDELDGIRALFDEQPEIDDQRHQDRTMQVIIRLEKMVDLPKPELAGLDRDGTLIPAFQSVPSCQQAVKDVDDESTQANG